MVAKSAFDHWHAVVTQLENESDRSVGIVGGSAIETTLEATIQANLQQDQTIIKALFRASGPIGSFSSKIDLGYLLGLFSKEVHRELVTIKDIRNSFAHRIEIEDFNAESIRALCSNLKIVERYCIDADVERERRGKIARERGTTFSLIVPDLPRVLSAPRTRFTQTIHVMINGLMGQAMQPRLFGEPEFR